MACLRFVKNPNRTEEVFRVSDQLSTSERFAAAVERLKKAQPGIKTLIEERYRPYAIALDLSHYRPGTLGHSYVQYMQENQLDPNFYEKLPIDSDVNYIRTRMRETHDFWHVILDFKTDPTGEAGLATAYVAQLGSPVMALVAGLLVVHAVLYDISNVPSYFSNLARGWELGSSCRSLLAMRWEERLHTSLDELRGELGIHGFFSGSTELNPLARPESSSSAGAGAGG